MTRIDGAVVLVTGANGGLGTEFVEQALERGAAKVYAAARRPRAWADGRVEPLQLDVTDHESVIAAAEAAADTTILVNNAGVLRRGTILRASLEDIRAQLETNFVGPVAMTQAFADGLRGAKGAVVNVASVMSWLAQGHGYSASKAALWSATDSMRLEFAPDDVHVVGAYLAYTDTPMNAGNPQPANDPADVVRAIYDGLVAGELEVLADEITRSVRAGLGAVTAQRYPELAR
ncbi:SDR family oxidoreductase [Streptomyces sp. SAI-229]|jgi:NAD(P)-dependent dehydrogenase (short-subunit alcohol dehydrogenase family)|uniref:SDR family oxidoreductase n=1 Tax=Streptomyces sp. SAI-229 TaxID=3377731 RepID=UPI003C7B9EF6